MIIYVRTNVGNRAEKTLLLKVKNSKRCPCPNTWAKFPILPFRPHDESIYISSYACAPETAAIYFKYTLGHCRENSPNKAYHLIQAVAPGVVSFEEAHQIGKKLADKVLEVKYSYVVTTHIDKGHAHNRIICAPILGRSESAITSGQRVVSR